MKIRALIVDDEPLAREKVRTLLESDDEVVVVAEARDGRQAVEAIQEHEPDLAFLDVQMPELDGFGVLQGVSPDRIPAIIFVTAHDEYALRAFDVHAIDYLLKPFDRQRFQQALARAKTQVRNTNQEAQRDGLHERILELLAQLQAERRPEPVERLVVKSGGRIRFVEVRDIDWIEAAGNYAELHVGDESHLIRTTMKSLEERLDPAAFLRVHRSAIVKIRSIKELQPWSSGEYVIILKNGTRIPTGAAYRQRLRRLLENPG